MYILQNFKINSKIIYLNFLLILLLSHFKYGIVYLPSINGHFELGVSLIDKKWSNLRNYYWSDSPLFNILQYFFKVNDFENYIILIYLLSLIFLFLISIKLSLLKEYSYLFVLGGWLVSVSWVFGLVDPVIVFCIISISINTIISRKFGWSEILLLVFLVFNHFAIALFFSFVIFFFIDKKIIEKVIKLTASYIVGFLINLMYKNIIGFNGETRLHFLLRQETIPELLHSFPQLLKYTIFSSFYGLIPILIYYLVFSKNKINVKLILNLTIALIGASLGTDFTRLFSYLIIPALIYILNEVQKSKINDINYYYFKKSLFIFSFLIILFFEEYWVIAPQYINHGSEYGGYSRILWESIVGKLISFKNLYF